MQRRVVPNWLSCNFLKGRALSKCTKMSGGHGGSVHDPRRKLEGVASLPASEVTSPANPWLLPVWPPEV